MSMAGKKTEGRKIYQKVAENRPENTFYNI
jgi:hypothetical protein